MLTLYFVVLLSKVQVWFLKHLLLFQFVQDWKLNEGTEHTLKGLININSLAKTDVGREGFHIPDFPSFSHFEESCFYLKDLVGDKDVGNLCQSML